MSRLSYVRAYADSGGESHLEDQVLDLAETSYAPPAPPLSVSDFFPAKGYHFLSPPPGWYGDWHPVPRRQVFLVLRGEVGVETSDGSRRRFGPGDFTLFEDTRGKGHRSWVVGDEPLLLGVVVLPD